MLVNGKWTADWQPVQAKDAKGGFVRQTSSFRNWVTPDGVPGRPAKAVRGRGWTLSSLCRPDLPLGLAHADRAQLKGWRRRSPSRWSSPR